MAGWTPPVESVSPPAVVTLDAFSALDFNGSTPQAALTPGLDGNLYGSTQSGGRNNRGTLFRLGTDGSFSKLHDFTFTDGANPQAALTPGPDGSLYGSTYSGGSNDNGTLFRLGTDGSFSKLHDFNSTDGANPYATLTPGPDGSLYGLTPGGGSTGNGTLFRLGTDGSFTKLHDFNGNDGANPYAALTLGPDGSLYGSTQRGGSNNRGTLFRLGADGSFSKLHDFSYNADGAYPYAALVPGPDGSLYGSTPNGGSTGNGTLFRLGTDGNFSNLHDFSYTDGAYPYAALTPGPDGSLYGSTPNGGSTGYGTLFRLGTDGNFSKLHDFNYNADGAQPRVTLTVGSDGSLYGSTPNGGSNGNGTLFRLGSDGSFSKLRGFSSTEGAYPQVALTPGPDGSLYGSTLNGGGNNSGTLFRLGTDGSFSMLHEFLGTDGATPYAALTIGSDGGLYGSTPNGGSTGNGTLFRLGTDGSFSKLHDFNTTDGAYPYAALTPGPDGSLYGSTLQGGSNNIGTLFRLGTDGSFSKLYDFNYTDGANPQTALTLAQDGSLYGSAQGGGSNGRGTLFRLGMDGSFSKLHDFLGTDGATPYAALATGPDGSLYGSTAGGGARNGGILFKLVLPSTQQAPVISWSNPVNMSRGTPLSAVQLNAAASFNGSPVAGTFTYSPPAGTILPAGNGQALSVVFTPSDTVHYTTAGATRLVNVLNRAPIAGNDTYTTDEHTVLQMTSPGLLANDRDPDQKAFLEFRFSGHMDESNADFASGAPFSGYYLIDPTVSAVDIGDPVLQKDYYSPSATWQLTFPASGIGFRGTYTDIALGNDTSFGDRFILALGGLSYFGNPLPSGRPLSFIQFDLVDRASGGADLLQDDSIQSTTLDLSLAQDHVGRVLYRDGSQPYFTLDSITGPLRVTAINGQPAAVNHSITLASGATLRVQSNGSFNYDPSTRTASLAPGTTDAESFSYEVSDIDGGTATGSVTITVTGSNDPVGLAIETVTPSTAPANSPAVSLVINGAGFDATTIVLWNGVVRPTTFVSASQLTAQIPATDLQIAGNVTAVQVTVRRLDGVTSNPRPFIITSPNVSSVASRIVLPGEAGTVSNVPTVVGDAGVVAVVSNLGAPANLTVTVATYTSNPTPATVVEVGGRFVDLQITGAAAGDTAQAQFYYPSTVNGLVEANLQLLYFNGSDWAAVRSSGGTEPTKDTTDDLVGTVSGGRFLVTFDNTSTPKITELNGTVFTATVVEPPQITTQPHALSVLAGASATFSVTATGGEPLSYQWSRDGVGMSGQTTRTLTLANVSSLDAAAYSVRVSNVAGQVVSQSVALTVTKRTPVVSWAAPSSIVYGAPLGAAQLNASADVPGTFTYTPGPGNVLAVGNARTLSATFTPSDANRYLAATVSTTINVTKAPLTIRVDNLPKIYGSPLPILTATYFGLVNGDTAASLSSQPTMTTAVTPATPVGSYPITITGGSAANYTITLLPGTLGVTKAPLTVTADNKSKVYGAALPTLTLTYSGFVNSDTSASLSSRPTLATTAVKASAAGVYPITLTGGAGPNYNITLVPGSLTVTPASLTITAQSKTKIYGNAVPTLTVAYAGFVNGDAAAALDTPVSLSTTATTNSPVGAYPIVVSSAADANYTITLVDATLTVTPRTLTITVQNKTKTYGAALPALTASYSGLAPGETAADLDVPAVVTTAATAASNVGTYPITISGGVDPNYTITLVNGTLTINRANLTVRAVNTSKVYGAAVPTLTYTFTGLVNGDTEASLDTPVAISTPGSANSPVGTYAIVPTGASDPNYTVTFVNGTLTVTKAPLTIKAQSATKVYGEVLPALTVSYTGFVLGENESVLTAAAIVATTATPSSNAGNYPITVNGATAANYAIAFQNGTLTVNKATLTISADNKTKTKGTANPAFTASYAGFVNGDTVASLDTAVAFSTTATTTSPVGSYPITPKTAKDVNYTVTFVNGTLAVTP